MRWRADPGGIVAGEPESPAKGDVVCDGITTTVVLILGMRDNACRERVTEALGCIKGVTDVSVSLMRARATVVHEPPCDGPQLMWAVVKAGYGASLASADGQDG